MMNLRIAPFVAAAALACPTAWSATAGVEFVGAEKYTDAGRRHADAERNSNLETLRRHIVEQAARALPAGEYLTVWIDDLDMAGHIEPGRIDEIRVVRDIYPPRIDLRFRLARADGSIVKEGARKLGDLSFLMGGRTRGPETMKYEKALLDQWLSREFRAPH